jgi:pimeloyl-ACP methyl ester carboxylesterase
MAERITIDLDGPVSVLDYGGTGPLIVCVHGLEGSAYNWSLIGPDLARSHRVLAPDLSGFGYTPPGSRGSTVEVNAQLVADVITHFGGEAILIGNSMGGLISMLAAETFPELVSGMVLIAPAAPVTNWLGLSLPASARLTAPIIPFLGPRIIAGYRALRTPEEGVDDALDFVAADPSSLDPRLREYALEVAEMRRTQDWSTAALIEAFNSIVPYVLRKTTFAKVLHRLSQPTLLVHGTEDQLVQPRTTKWMSRQRPDWTVAYFNGVGHVPMMEVPDELLAVFDVWESVVFDVTTP